MAIDRAETALLGGFSANGADSEPRQQRALRWLRHPALLVLGLLDEKGHAVRTANDLLEMATQGTKGIAQATLPCASRQNPSIRLPKRAPSPDASTSLRRFMPDGLDQKELES